MRIKSHVQSLVVAAVFAAARGQAETPQGWFVESATRKDYETTVDNKVSRTGKACASIRSIAAKPNSFGGLMQTFTADDYLGKRVRLTGYVKTLNANRAQLLMRVDRKGTQIGDPSNAFDNMYKRPVTGTSDWTKCEVVLDVAEDATHINFGCMLIGTGKLWFDDLKFEVVGKDVPVTDMNAGKVGVKLLKAPQNLDFEAME